MGLQYGYGVVVGTLDRYERDPVNNYGQYYHENLYVNTPGGVYHCAIDVDTNHTNDGIQWRVVPINEADMKGVFSFSNGWHALTCDADSGALDNVRTKAFHKTLKWAFFRRDSRITTILNWLRRFLNPPWKAGTSIDALTVLEPLLDASSRLFVFGEPFHNGLGVHNIHQNQGDPAGSQWWAENGIWQDGATIIQKNDGKLLAFLTKFKTQAEFTDNAGHPV